MSKFFREITESIQSGDSTARLMKYNPTTGEVSAMLKNLAGATGVACSKDGKFVLVAEYIGKRIQKYWLQRKKAGKAETIIKFTGYPVKVKRNNEGNFWVALNSQKEDSSLPQGIKIDCNGEVLDSVDLRREYNDQYITTVQEHKYKLYIASPFENYVGVYNIES
ncbi:protein strictosidine synthase-like 11 [Nicotiana attenuata]|uniref:Protein strictosidine synthase-like 11 n=1 Tax=Nicotiana attenuata TaxID=49451 RepID=A0A314L146_NICAT|nr:protein strictosidine synthase-like 11 [Nicotiana attenuata]